MLSQKEGGAAHAPTGSFRRRLRAETDMENDILSKIIEVEREIQEGLVAEERNAGTMLCNLRQELEDEAAREEERLAAERRNAESSARAEAQEQAVDIVHRAIVSAEQWGDLDEGTLEQCIMRHLDRIMPEDNR